jgi:TetR/AcrR family transcriptional regulator, tetracycline repressor protein
MRLRRADVLAGALDQLDRDGLENLTMQALAKSLGVRPGALYWHYADKRALIDAMAEAIIAGLQLTDDGSEPWDQSLLRFSQAVHAALLSRRDGARLVAGTFVARQNTLRAGLTLVEILRGAGLDVQDAATAALSVFYYILGYAIEEQSRLALAADDRWDEHQDEVREMAPADVGEALTRAQESDTFAAGIEMLIAGIRTRVPLGGKPKGRSASR